MRDNKITDSIYYVGCYDNDIDLFESQYKAPHGITYNSYVIFDEKITIMDTVDKRKEKEWKENLDIVLDGKEPTYLVVQHVEPDHSANIKYLTEKYPNMQVIASQKAFEFINQFFKVDLSDRAVVVKEGDKVSLGKHELNFVSAPMVHWPEVILTYESTEKILFSADAFGKFGEFNLDDGWEDEARRFFINIVGRYGMQVQALLKKAAALDINKICPLHGPVLEENLSYYIDKYDTWSSYRAESDGVLVLYNSIHGNTRNAIEKLEEILKDKGVKDYKVFDLARTEMSVCIANAYKYEHLILASPTYDMGLFPHTDLLLKSLKHKSYQNRKVGLIENGSWAPCSGKLMKEEFESMKDIVIAEPVVTIKSSIDEEGINNINIMVENLLK